MNFLADVLLENVTKKFEDGVVAVKDLYIEVKDKEFVVLLGPSGCGKTTTLRLIAGLEMPTSGKIYIGGEDVTKLEPWARDVAMVFQSYALYPHMTVYDNIAFPLKMRKCPKAEISRRVEDTAELLEIKDFLKRKPRQLSGGQRQRVALARAIVRNPRVFLMDEPLSNLDAKLRVLMRIELKKLQKRLGVTTIYVTHDQTEAMTLADRVAIQFSGALQQYAPPTKVYSRPENKFVAGFIGTPPMNLIDGKLSIKENQGTVEADDFTIKIDQELKERLTQKNDRLPTDITYGVRPQDCRISARSEQREWVTGKVYGVELLGSENVIHVEVGKNRIVALASDQSTYQMGDTVRVNLTSKKAHIFDRNTEKNLML